MLNEQQKTQLTQLRVAGHSIRSVAEKMRIGKTTVAKYSQQLKTTIDAERFAQEEDLAIKASILRQDRVRRLTADLEKVETQLKGTTLEKLSPTELIRLKSALLRDIKGELAGSRLLTSTTRRETTKGNFTYDNQYLELDG